MNFSTVYFIMEFIGTISFAISGAIIGIEKRMDVLGILVLGVITAVGGGIMRDMIIGITPPLSFRNQTNIILAICTVVIFIICHISINSSRSVRYKRFYDELMFLSDSVGLGVFTILGINVGIKSVYKGTFLLYIVLGVLTGTGGGILRDIMANEIPAIFKKRIYALASIIGGICYILLLKILDKYSSMLISIALIIFIRYFSKINDLNLPRIGTK